MTSAPRPVTDSSRGHGRRDESGGLVANAAVSFGAVMLLLAGILDVFQGIAALANETVFALAAGYSFRLDLTTWGWIHLAVGALAIITAGGVLAGQTWGRVLGIGAAGLTALTNFLFIPYYPFWSITVIVYCAVVIWALSMKIRDEA